MKVLVVGASTPLGLAVVEELARGSDVERVLAVGREPAPPDAEPDARVVYRSLDLTHPRAIHDLVWGEARHLGIDAVFHAAQHRRARDRGRRVHAQNVDALRHLLAACEGHPTIRRFVYRSFGDVYAVPQTTTGLVDERDPLDFDPLAPSWLRDRVEADAIACMQLGTGALRVTVLRCAELLAADSGSQLHDYLMSRVCMVPFGYDPMINVLGTDDACAAVCAALRAGVPGVFNIAGADTLPLSAAIRASGRIAVPVPGPLLAPAYRLRRALAGFEFRYDLNARRFHFGGILDGTRARTALGYTPRYRSTWGA